MGRKKTKRSAKVIGLLFAASLVWLVTSYIIGVVKENLVEKEILKYGPLKEVISTTGYLIREEEVLAAPNNGTLTKISNEGARVRINSVVAEVKTPSMETVTGQANRKIKAPCAGIVTYQLDGMENLFAIENWEKIKPKEVLELEEVEVQKGEAQLEQGRPLVKIVDNLAPSYIYFQLEAKDFDSNAFAEGDFIKFVITSKGAEDFREGILGKISRIKQEDGFVQVLFTSRKLSELALIDRKLELEIIKNEYEGYVVPEESLITQDGQTGVFLIYKQVVRWVPAKIVGTVGDIVVIENISGKSSLKENMQIIVNHGLVKEGQKVN